MSRNDYDYDALNYAESRCLGDVEDDYDYDDSDAWKDGSDVGCGDCPESECNGHCMSCAYRSF